MNEKQRSYVVYNLQAHPVHSLKAEYLTCKEWGYSATSVKHQQAAFLESLTCVLSVLCKRGKIPAQLGIYSFKNKCTVLICKSSCAFLVTRMNPRTRSDASFMLTELSWTPRPFKQMPVNLKAAKARPETATTIHKRQTPVDVATTHSSLFSSTVLILLLAARARGWWLSGRGGGCSFSVQRGMNKALDNRVTLHGLHPLGDAPAFAGQLLKWKLEARRQIVNRTFTGVDSDRSMVQILWGKAEEGQKLGWEAK